MFPEASKGFKCLGVVGHPLGHTFSPKMHQAAYEALGWKDVVYRAMPVEPSEWGDFVRQAKDVLFGFNVTVPYKEKIYAAGAAQNYTVIDEMSFKISHFVEASNTVAVGKDYISTYNTDAEGFWDDLAAHKIGLKNQNMVLLGAGGAARALLGILYLKGASPQKVTVYDCDVNKAKSVLLGFKEACKRVREPGVKELPLEIETDGQKIKGLIRQSSVLINATPVGLKPGETPVDDPDCLHKDLTLYDLIYHHTTALMEQVEKKGGRAVGGLGMLVRQGARSFKIWFEKEPPIDAMFQAVEKELKDRRNAQ